MAIWLSLDFETTGLDKVKDRITEPGLVLWSTKINRVVEAASFLVKTDVSVSKEVEEKTGISNALLKKFGCDEDWAVEETLRFIEASEYVIGQNVCQFDKHFIYNAAARHSMKVPERLWVDTRTDLPLHVETKSLTYMAADHGFLNPFPHVAIADGLTVLKIASAYDLDAMVKRAQEPTLVIRSHQAFENNADAKKLKFMFKAELGKKWLRVIKQSDLEVIGKTAPFDISIEKEITPDQVWYS